MRVSNPKGGETLASEEQIKEDIKSYIDDHGGQYNRWYVGISDNARKRLFDDHNVDEDSDLWIYRTASSATVARRVEDYFVNELGTDGGTGGGDENSNQVYAYKKNSHTDP